MLTNANSVFFNFSDEDKKLFDPVQHEHWDNIKKYYEKLKKECLSEVYLPQSGSHRGWITSRVNFHVSQSLMRLLYLTEEFCNSANAFNSVATAALAKSITEVPLHIGYIVWILSECRDFEKIRQELHKISFGNRDPKTGLTTSGKITHKELYTRSDQMLQKLFKDEPSKINIVESFYKDSNATGHHNYEACMLTGIQNKDTWKAGDRKELFIFFSNKIFPFFLHCDATLGISSILLNAIKYHLENLPENFTKR